MSKKPNYQENPHAHISPTTMISTHNTVQENQDTNFESRTTSISEKEWILIKKWNPDNIIKKLNQITSILSPAISFRLSFILCRRQFVLLWAGIGLLLRMGCWESLLPSNSCGVLRVLLASLDSIIIQQVCCDQSVTPGIFFLFYLK